MSKVDTHRDVETSWLVYDNTGLVLDTSSFKEAVVAYSFCKNESKWARVDKQTKTTMTVTEYITNFMSSEKE